MNSGIFGTDERNQIRYRPAVPADDPQLLEILEAADFKGNISLLYTRRPSPLRSLQRDGEQAAVIVGEKLPEGKLVSLLVCTLNTLYMDGQAACVGYICSLRIRREYLGAIRYFREVAESVLRFFPGVKTYYASILTSNRIARRLLEKKRPGTSTLHFLGLYEVYAVKTGGRKRLLREYSCTKCRVDDIPALLEFLGSEGALLQGFPVLSAHALQTACTNPHYSDFYLLRDSGNAILAAGAVWNQQAYKQYIVQGFRGYYKLLMLLMRVLTLLGFPRIEQAGETMNFFTLSCFAARQSNPAYFNMLVAKIREYNRQYSYFVAGFFHNNKLKQVCKRLPHFLYTSRIYQVCRNVPGRQEPLLTDTGQIAYFECGRL